MKDILKILPSTELYQEFIIKLIKDTFLDEFSIPYINKGITVDDRLIDSVYVALLDEEPVGFYCIWTNEFHPHSLYFSMIVDKKYRRRKIATTLYQHMVNLGTNFFYLQSSFYETSSTGSSFLRNLGFRLYRTTQEPQIETSDIIIDFEKMKDFIKEFELEVLALSDIKSENEFLHVVEIAKDCYTDSHLDNPVKEMKIEAWENLIRSDLIAEGSFMLKNDKKIIAFALLHENDDSTMDLGWRGVVEKYDFIRPRLIELLTKLQIEFAQQSNKRILNTEIDNTDKWSFDMLSFLNLEKTNKWLTYQQRMEN